MSDPEAEQRQLKRRMLEEQLRMLDDEERHSRTSMSNTPVTASGSYPPQWAATISNPSSSRHSALSSSIYDASHTQQGSSSRNPHIPSTSSSSSWADLSNQDRNRQYQHQPQSSSQSHRPPSVSRSNQQQHQQRAHTQPQARSGHQQQQQHNYGQYQTQNQNQHQSQPLPYSSGSTRHHSFRDLDRSSTGPSSSISPQFSSALPTPQNATFSSSQTVPLPSERQLHDWLRDCMGQVEGLDTDWRINGKRVDMYKLLASVIRSGGSTEVSSRGWWYMLAKLLNLADDLTPQTVKSSIAKQLQELFLQMLGGLEILWDKTKGTEEREAIPRTRENSNLSGSSTLPTPISATMNPGLYSQHQSSASSRHASNNRREVPSAQQEHHYVDPSKLILPPKAAKVSGSQQFARGGDSTNVRQQSAISTLNSNSAHSNTVNSAYNNPHHSPPSFARPTSVASNGTQQSPNIPSQIPLHQPTPFHPPPHRLPDILTSQNDGGSERSQGSSSQSHIAPPAKSASADMVPSPSQQSSRTVQLRFANKSLGEYQVPDLTSFQELVTSNVLPLPPLEPDSNVQRMTWSSDPLIRYSKRCHELGHSVRKLKAGQASRQISPEELVFWAKLLVIMAGNPSVIPPPVDDRPPSNPPPTSTPNLTSSSITTAGPLGSFTNPIAFVPPPSGPGPSTSAHNQGDQPTTSSQDGRAIGQPTAFQSKKRPRKSGDDTAGSHTDMPTVPKKRGRKPGVPNRPKQPITITPAVPSQVESQPVLQSTQVSQNQNNGVPQAPQLQAAPLSRPPNDIVSGTQPTQIQIDQASAALAFIGPAERVPAKRGRPKGSKTVNRKSLPQQLNGQERPQSDANIDPAILVPASQPESIPSYSQYDSLAQLSQPPASFQDLFGAEHENEGFHPSLFAGLADAGPSSSAPAPSLPFSTPSRPDQNQLQASQALETNSVSGGSNRKPLTAEQRADKSAKEKARRQRLKEIQGIFAPPMKYKKPPIDPSTRIPLVPNLSPKRIIDLSSPDRASSAQIRAQDMGPTRIIGRTASALSHDLSAVSTSQVEKTKKYKKKQNVAHDLRTTGQTSQAATANIDIMNIDPKFTQDDGYEPSPAQVQELARALVESIGPIPDTQVEGEEELHRANDADAEGEAESDIPHYQVIQSKKKKRGKPRKEKKIVSVSQSQQGPTVVSTPARKSILVVEVPSSKKTARVKFDEEVDEDELDPEAEIEVIQDQREESPEYEPSPEFEDDGEGEQEIEEIEDEDEDEDEQEGRRSKRKRNNSTTRKPVFEKIPGGSGRGGFSVVGAASSAAKARWDRIKRRSLELSPSTSTRRSTRGTPQASPSIRPSARERRTSSVVPIPDILPRSGSTGRRSNSRLGSIRREAQPNSSTKTESKSQRRVNSVVVNPAPEIEETLEQLEDESEDELELEEDQEDEGDDVGFAVEIDSPRIVRRRVEKKRNVSSPVDRAKVVIPISRRRREQLISRGHYNAFRDDDSDDERPLPRRAHVSLRPMKLTIKRGSRTIRPSSPEPIPLRFMFRPGPALLEPFASILTETSLSNRVHEYPCLWKGCDSILASEELLKRHVENRQHARQGKEEVSTERWSWNTRRTTERQVVKGKWFYRCHWKGCEEPCFTSEADLGQHLTARHISKVLKCPYEACELTSLNISHLSRHIMKQHDSPSDHPVPLANISVPLHPASPPTGLLPEIARADELTTQRVLGSAHRSAFYNTKVKEKVASHCFAGPDPVIHVEHPPHMLDIVDDEDDVIDSTGKEKKRRVQVVVEIPMSKRRKLTEQEKRDRVLRMMDSIDTAIVPSARQDQQHNNDSQENQTQDHNVIDGENTGSYSPSYAYESAPTPWIETDAMMIEDELVLGAPTPAPFPMSWNDQDDDDDDVEEEEDRNEAGPSGVERDDEGQYLPLFQMPSGDDEEDEQEANAELQEEEEEEDDDLFREFAEAVQAQDEPEVVGPEDSEITQQNGMTEDQQEIDIDAPSRNQHSIIKPNMSTSVLFSPSLTTPAIPPASNGVATPVPQRKGSISFPFPPQSRPSPISNNISASTGVGTNSPLRFGFAERFVASEIPSTSDVQDEPATATSTVVTSASSSKYTALEEAVQVSQESEDHQNNINTEDVFMNESNDIADEDVVRLNEVQVEMLS